MYIICQNDKTFTGIVSGLFVHWLVSMYIEKSPMVKNTSKITNSKLILNKFADDIDHLFIM